jgi:hypothetical protein
VVGKSMVINEILPVNVIEAVEVCLAVLARENGIQIIPDKLPS